MKNLSIPLRDYQADLTNKVDYHFSEGIKRILIQLPTGGGKSLILSEIVSWFFIQQKRVLIVAHKIELLNQLSGHIKKWLNHEPAVIGNKSLFTRDFSNQIQIASIQTLSRLNLKEVGTFDLIVIDEAHHSSARTYTNLFNHYQESKIVGLTATPVRIDGKGFKYLFNGVEGFELLIKGVDTNYLIDRNYLSEFKLFAPEYRLQDVEQKISKGFNGDFKQDELEYLCLDGLPPRSILEAYQAYSAGKQAIIFPVSVEVSRLYNDYLNQAGINSAHIDAKTSSNDRQQIISDFGLGKIQVLCQHSIVVEGFDVPAIETVIFARPTKSIVIWFQGIGRSLRVAPNKPYATIIDLTDNFERLPMPTDAINWSLDPIQIEPNLFSKLCPNCCHVFNTTQFEVKQGFTVCPNCGTKLKLDSPSGGFELPEGDNSEFDTEPELLDYFIDTKIDFTEAIDRALKLQKTNGYKKGWIWFYLQDLIVANNCTFPTETEMKILAQKLKYKPAWGFYKRKELMEVLNISDF